MARFAILLGVFLAALPSARATAIEPSFQEWLNAFPPGRHVLSHIPPFATWKKSDGGLSSFQGAAYDLQTGDVYLQTGGHGDGWKDNIHRVNLMTGRTLVTQETPLTRRIDLGTTKNGKPRYIMLPQADDYVTRHNGAGFLFKDGKLIIGGYTPSTNKARGIMYYEGRANIPAVFEIDVTQLKDGDRRPVARPLSKVKGKGEGADYIGGYGFYTLLPDGKVFIGTNKRWRIVDDDGHLVSEGQSGIGWNGCYLPAQNAIAGITYNKAVLLARLDSKMSGVATVQILVSGNKDRPWSYHSGIVRWSDHEVLVNSGGEQMQVIDVMTGNIKSQPNVFYIEPNNAAMRRPFNRLMELAPGRYLYYPTDQRAQPVLYVKR